MVEGIDSTSRRISLGSKSRVDTIIDLERCKKSDILSYPQDEADPWTIKVIHQKRV